VLIEGADPDRGLELLREALSLAEETGVSQAVPATSRIAIGVRHLEQGAADAARSELSEAQRYAAEHDLPDLQMEAAAHLALLPGADAADAEELLARLEDRLGGRTRRLAHWLLWRTTSDESHLQEAHRLLDEALGLVPEEFREAMVEGVPLNHGIAEAWRAAAPGAS
jgi:hypothetical protein